MRRSSWILIGSALLLAPGCAKRIGPAATALEDYLYPAPEPGELPAAEELRLRAAWRDVLSGDVNSARREIERVRRRIGTRPSFETVAAYASLRGGGLAEAERRFSAVLERAPAFVPALVGAGSTASRRGDAEAALGFYRRAQAAAPDEALVRKRAGALKLQLAERHLGLARAAMDVGQAENALAEYRSALAAAPEVSGMRLALAELLSQRGDAAGAIGVLAADPSGDRQIRLRLASALTDANRFEEALDVYRELLARDPSDAAIRAGYVRARDRFETALMPEEYRRLPEAAQVTRADLAALLVTRVKALRRVAPIGPQLAVDVSGSWAREQILSALSLELMDVYPNHTFQPSALVRRAELARTAARALDLLHWPRASAAEPTDVSRSHLDHQAVQRTLGAGLMGLNDTGAFEPWRLVSGREALEVVDALERLLGS